MAYATLTELRLLLRLEHPGDDTFAQLCLDSAEVGINKFCHRNFNAPPGSATTRVYVPTHDVVMIDDLASTTGVTVTNFGAAVTSTAMQWEPLNQLSTAMSYTPYTAIRLTTGYWTVRGQEATVSVTSDQWGWTGGCPTTVKRATLELAKDLFQYKDMRAGVSGFGEFGAVRLRENPAIAMMLDPTFVRYDRIGIA